jgi:transcriptional regulator ATRX
MALATKSMKKTSRPATSIQQSAAKIVNASVGPPSNTYPISTVVPATPRVISDTPKASDFVLCNTKVRKVSIDPGIAKQLKPHQVEAAHFMWNNCLADFATEKHGNPGMIGGCIVAHSMGLGKSLAAISLIHTVLTHPAMMGANKEPLLPRVLLVAPVNTILHWVSEISKWQKESRRTFCLYSINECNANSRRAQIKSWMENIGLLLISENAFKILVKDDICQIQPDLIILDEIHTMLKKSTTKIYEALHSIRTPRRIGKLMSLSA